MRIITGVAKGRRLVTPKDMKIRPTADRIKEALFSILSSRLSSWNGLKVLDLFAGTGNLGIEALSRGAEYVVFADSSREANQLIKENLRICCFTEQATVLQSDALKSLQYLHRTGNRFDLIFLDPPYGEDKLLSNVLTMLSENQLLSGEGLIIVESSGRADTMVPEGFFELADSRIYGDTKLTFLSNCKTETSVSESDYA